MRKLLQKIADSAHLQAHWLLPVFVVSVAVLNGQRWREWDIEGLTLYLTHPIMRTTLFDFAWVLAIVTLFIHQDARKHGLRYWYILPTFPVMPTVGLLIYIWLRHRKLAKTGRVPPLGA